jgi:hypothetical protein
MTVTRPVAAFVSALPQGIRYHFCGDFSPDAIMTAGVPGLCVLLPRMSNGKKNAPMYHRTVLPVMLMMGRRLPARIIAADNAAAHDGKIKTGRF